MDADSGVERIEFVDAPGHFSRGKGQGATGYCVKHRKFSYKGRKAARRAARILYPNDHLTPFACKIADGLFHIGHLKPEIIAGDVSRKFYQ